MAPFVLLLLSNVFMTFAWYGHLKHKEVPLWKAIAVSWLIAFFEYCLQVPANRMGSNAGYSTSQLKIAQEAITLVGVLRVRGRVYGGAAEVELRGGVWAGVVGGVFCVL